MNLPDTEVLLVDKFNGRYYWTATGWDLWYFASGTYSAGCRGPWSAAQALNHWNRDDRQDDRAILFTLAIGIIEHTKGK